MNFLAHFYLSCSEPEMICGNFLGDFIKNRELKLLPKEWLKGIELHRKIDTFTDTHNEVKKCTKLLHPTQGKYAPVVVDVFFDYVLYRNWSTYSAISFPDFEDQIYAALLDHCDRFPLRLQSMTRSMVRDRFLRSYTSYEGLAYTFKRMKPRFKFKTNIDSAVSDLQRNYDDIEASFNRFFPEIIGVAESYCTTC